MPICELASEETRPLHKTTFGPARLQMRRDLQRPLRANISVVAPDRPVIADALGDFDRSRRRIDLLGSDRDANLARIGKGERHAGEDLRWYDNEMGNGRRLVQVALMVGEPL